MSAPLWRGSALVAAAALAATVHATGTHGVQGQSRELRPQRLTGTAVVGGVVLVADAAASPVRRAIVTLESESGHTQAAISDDAGRFVLTSLAPGRYALRASRAGFVDAEYGARRPGRMGRRLAIEAGQAVHGVTLHMARGAVMTGRVTQANGQPAAGLPVLVHRDGQTPSLFASRDTRIVTDDQGMYRAFGLAPGRYLAAVVPATELSGEQRVPASDEIDRIFQELRQGTLGSAASPARTLPPEAPRRFSWAPVYHPGTARRANAIVVEVGAGEERGGVDIALAPVPVARVHGQVHNPGGPVPAVQLWLAATAAGTPVSFSAPVLSARPGPDGRFMYSNVPPGEYTITARVTAPEPLFATTSVLVDGRDVESVTLTLQPSMSLSGRLELAGDGPPPVADLATLRLTLQPPPALRGSTVINGTSFGRSFTATGAFRPDGTFDIRGILPGEYQPAMTLPAAGGWWLRSVEVGGRDVLDGSLTFQAASLTGAVVTLTNRHTQLSGRLVTSTGEPALDYHVVVISADRGHWLPGARRTRATRPDTGGRFVVSDLPAGSYLLIALDDLDPSDLDDSAFLEVLAPGGIPIAIADGQSVEQDVRIAR